MRRACIYIELKHKNDLIEVSIKIDPSSFSVSALVRETFWIIDTKPCNRKDLSWPCRTN